jgi:hypothetical protein
MSRKKVTVTILAAFIVIGLLVAWGLPRLRPWEGFDYQSHRRGAYRTLEVCRSQVESVGGWCGKGCRDYGEGLIANCDPLVAVANKAK